MAYVPANLFILSQPLGSSEYPRVFGYYDSAASADSTIVGSGWFSDGVLKGMRVGDIVDVVQTGTAKYKRYQVASVSGNAATVAAPTAIT